MNMTERYWDALYWCQGCNSVSRRKITSESKREEIFKCPVCKKLTLHKQMVMP
jgi:hypothetical protein